MTKAKGVLAASTIAKLETRLENTFNLINEENDRGAILIACCLIEEALTESLASSRPTEFSRKLFDSMLEANGPLGTFSSKIQVMYLFDLISRQTFHISNALRKARNVAAHSNMPFVLADYTSQFQSLRSSYPIGEIAGDYADSIGPMSLNGSWDHGFKKQPTEVKMELSMLVCLTCLETHIRAIMKT